MTRHAGARSWERKEGGQRKDEVNGCGRTCRAWFIGCAEDLWQRHSPIESLFSTLSGPVAPTEVLVSILAVRASCHVDCVCILFACPSLPRGADQRFSMRLSFSAMPGSRVMRRAHASISWRTMSSKSSRRTGAGSREGRTRAHCTVMQITY